MLIKIFSLTFNSSTGGFDDRELQEFIKGKEVISMTDHFFMRNDIPYMAITIKYYPHRKEAEPPTTQAKANKQKESAEEPVSPENEGVYNLLRDWRLEQAKKEGVPPYIIFNNKQFHEMLRIKPQTVGELERVSGIGKVKADKYGADLLRIMQPLQEEAKPKVEPSSVAIKAANAGSGDTSES